MQIMQYFQKKLNQANVILIEKCMTLIVNSNILISKNIL